MARRSKRDLVQELIHEFRESCNQDDAFDSLAAQCLGVSETDLRCLNMIENGGGLSAGELAAQSGLTAGAITGVIDRLERAGFARRVLNPADRRRITVEVTPAFYTSADRIWGPLAGDWHTTLLQRFTTGELERIADFLRAINQIGRQNLDRLRACCERAGAGALPPPSPVSPTSSASNASCRRSRTRRAASH